jgi:hypothetical protein
MSPIRVPSASPAVPQKFSGARAARETPEQQSAYWKIFSLVYHPPQRHCCVSKVQIRHIGNISVLLAAIDSMIRITTAKYMQ